MQIYNNLSLDNLDGEEWRPVPGYPQYRVSNLGRVKSFVKRPRILRQAMNYRGYLYLWLFVNWKKRCFKVHQVVAMAFCINNENKKEINHIDSNKQNNKCDNLEWSTRSENMKHMIKSVGAGHRLGITNPKATMVMHTEYGIICTMREAAVMSGFKEANFNNMMYEIGYRKNRSKFVFI